MFRAQTWGIHRRRRPQDRKFELADEGTIFLDEIGDMELGLQGKVLRVLEGDRFMRVGGTTKVKADVRLIAATNKDLEAAVAAQAFRADLFYRLNVFPIIMPPLAERRDDIPLLVDHFLGVYARELKKDVKRCRRKRWIVMMRLRGPAMFENFKIASSGR